MNRVLYIFIMLVVMCSCRTKKETTNTVLDERLIKKIEALIQYHDSVILSRREIFNFSEITEIIEREFDTTVKPDSLGNYPIVKETITKIDKKGDKEVQEETKSESKTDIVIKEDQEQNKKEEVVIKKESKENSSFKYFFVSLAIVLLIIVFVFLKRVGFFLK